MPGAKGQRVIPAQPSVGSAGVSVAGLNFRSKTDRTADCGWTAEAGSLREVSEQAGALTDLKETEDQPVIFFRQRQEKKEAEPGRDTEEKPGKTDGPWEKAAENAVRTEDRDGS